MILKCVCAQMSGKRLRRASSHRCDAGLFGGGRFRTMGEIVVAEDARRNGRHHVLSQVFAAHCNREYEQPLVLHVLQNGLLSRVQRLVARGWFRFLILI